MAYRSILGGSPLGIIGVRSAPTNSGLTSFNIDASRNVSVAAYNKSRAGSLFTGKRRLRAWPNLQKTTGGKSKSKDGVTEDITGTSRSVKDQEAAYEVSPLHSDSVYDTSILNIVEKLAGTAGSVKPQDFAYLKNVGVYPNNRLIICRRFLSPMGDNIMTKAKTWGAAATLISWIPESDDFLKISFGEEWEAAEADFKNVLNSMGEDIGLSNLGGIGGAGGNISPLPGFTEIFQREFLRDIGLLESTAANMIPAGNPNLIKEAKKRKTIGYSEAGSGLTCTVSINVKCEYELKYISGIDPTIVWMDILTNITRFGTSTSETYGLSGKFAAKLIGWANNPWSLITDVLQSIKNIIEKVKKIVKRFIEALFNTATAAAQEAGEEEDGSEEEDAEEEGRKAAQEEKGIASKLLDKVIGVLRKVTNAVVGKYRVRIIGIVNALSGLPSTPWHITIGNPLRPVFCAGDMYTKSVSMTLGPQLAFNDLPSSITAEFSLENARPWGMQEIMAKFNSGYLRSVDVQKTFYETGATKAPNSTTEVPEPMGAWTGEVPPFVEPVDNPTSNSNASGGSNSGSTVSSTGGQNTNTNGENGIGSTVSGTVSENRTYISGQDGQGFNSDPRNSQNVYPGPLVVNWEQQPGSSQSTNFGPGF